MEYPGSALTVTSLVVNVIVALLMIGQFRVDVFFVG